ncbi:tRNA wybutosine-synthesizing protein 3 homolog [Orbicella faveolata]|uniref:tRNA wybutosine-synthesizing protein 3 homolog n=1 Tax=Orbicella faveolata TaxID=48498 RepID=UPI0009E3ADA4|nr:tRNA wybutosine-synthesizing protein 3 homolog [Orbicella faveolata]
MAAFEEQKASCLSQVDLSKKGSIDDQIVDLVQYINAKDDYFTTSSCSGRISVFSELADQKKKHCEWLYVTHSTATEEEVVKSLKGCLGSAVFKFEPFVLHVQCKDLVAGQQMLKVALTSGFKNSGIVIGKKANVIVAVRSTQSLEVPLAHKGELMVSYKYIEFLVNAANKKLEENQTRINRFFENLRQLLSECDDTCSNCTLQKTGRTPKIKGTKQNELALVHVTSQQSNLDTPEQSDDDDALDCLVSFYGGVS